jgi:hypothetical protein
MVIRILCKNVRSQNLQKCLKRSQLLFWPMKIFPRLFLYTISEHSFTNVRLLEENGNREHFFTNVRLLEENGNLHRNRKSKQLKFFLNSECKCLIFNKLFWALKPYFFFFYFVMVTVNTHIFFLALLSPRQRSCEGI